MIYTFCPYDVDKNLGKAYNSCMDLLQPDDWAIFIDHDTLFAQADWGRTVKRAIEENPEYGLFTGVTNRIPHEFQLAPGVDRENHDIAYHMEMGEKLNRYEVVEFDPAWPPISGFIIIIQKKVWDLIGGAREGLMGVDFDLHQRCRVNGIKAGLIRSLYLYHWYRGFASLEEASKLNHLAML